MVIAVSLCPGQSPTPSVDKGVADKIKREVAEPITRALPGWLVGDDLGPTAIEAWDSKDARRLRATLVYPASERAAGAAIERSVASIGFLPGLTLLKEDRLCRRVLSEEFAEAVSLVKTPDRYRLHLHRTVVLSDAFMPPMLLATFSSKKDESLEDFKASVAARIRGLDPAFDTFLMLALQRRVQWDGDARVTITCADKAWTFAAPVGFTRVADGASIALWKADHVTARVHALLGAEQDAAAFAKRWLEEPCTEGGLNNTPLVLDAPAAGKPVEYEFVQLPQVNAKGYLRRVQILGSAPLFIIYDVAIDIMNDTAKAATTPAVDAAVKAAFAATKEAPIGKATAPAKKG
ncbi:MAG TPA: hypothetical protein VK348_07510 [Planctomycetota bacterium]|nr:hypothetical protein [Planctomycetota bacterium]